MTEEELQQMRSAADVEIFRTFADLHHWDLIYALEQIKYHQVDSVALFHRVDQFGDNEYCYIDYANGHHPVIEIGAAVWS